MRIKPIDECRWQTGASLPIVMIIAGMLASFSLISLDAWLLSLRATQHSILFTWQFHMADTALTNCERRLRSAVAPASTNGLDTDAAFDVLARAMGDLPEPSAWRQRDAFSSTSNTLYQISLNADGERFDIPCLVEPWIDRGDAGRVSLLTVRVMPRGTSTDNSVGVWLQSIVVLSGGQYRRHWRRVAEPPR